jgi:hypothetical protein
VVVPLPRHAVGGILPARLGTVEATASTSPLRLHLATPSRVEVVAAEPCAICGGASIVTAHIAECQARYVPRAFLVPRPTSLLVIAQASGACNPALP